MPSSDNILVQVFFACYQQVAVESRTNAKMDKD
jgi:hypothetical protein